MLRQFVNWLASGEKTPADLLALCLGRIAQADPDVRAWVAVDPREPLGRGPLYGIPFGAKDVFETRRMATAYGSPLFAGRRGAADAALVARLRGRGAVLLGKTATAAFAYYDPPATRNPRDLARTPGGSSSGSAAAVAAGMVPFALGTQTQGSVLRPAAFCGIAGFKPTFGLLPYEGALPFAPSLDTAGLFTETAADMQALWERAGWGRTVAPPPAVAAWLNDYAAPPALALLRAAGWRIDEAPAPEHFADLADAVKIINAYEGARSCRELWERHGDAVGRRLAALVAEGLGMPEDRYLAARECVMIGKQEISEMFRRYSVVLSPAAPGPAPLGLASTGDPCRNAPWTGLGVPAITVPLPGANPPLGLQIAAAAGHDDLLLAAAVQVESCFTL